MGKKKGKSKTHDYYLGTGKVGELMKRYDIKGTRFSHPDGRSSHSNGGDVNDGSPRTREDVDRDIAKAMMNDYDTRRSFEAAALDGFDGAKKFAKKGFKGKNIYDAWDVYKDMKKHYVGGGGMRGPKNEAGLTWAAVKSDRDNLIDSLSTNNSDDDGGNDNPVKPEYEPSEYLAAARARVQLHDEEILNGQYSENLYDKDYRPTDGGGFLARYKLKMKDSGLNLG